MFRISILMLVALAASGQEQFPPTSSTRAKFSISGMVVHAVSGQPLSKVEVAIGPAAGADSVQSMVTTEGGRFYFENLSSGKYWLAAQAKGFSPQRLDAHEEFSTAIAVGPSVESSQITFRLRPDATITGGVIDEQNDPVRGAQVMLYRSDVQNGAGSSRLAGQTMTDDRGIYRFSHRPPGTYYVAVTAQPWYAENYFRTAAFESGGDLVTLSSSAGPTPRRSELDVTYPITYYPGTADPSGATPIGLKPGDHAVADFALTPVPALHLRITGIDTSQGANAILSQHGMGEHPVQILNRTANVAKDEIEISGIPPGQFDLILRTWGKNPTVREKPIDVSEDAQIAASDGTAAPSVNGRVQFEGGKPLLRAAFVQFINAVSGQGFGAQISAKGEFETSNQTLLPGKYDVFVFGLPNAVIANISATGAKVTGHELEIGGGATVSVTISLSQGVGRVDGTALRDGKPFAEAMVALIPEDLEHNSTQVRRDQSDSDGTFSLFNVVPGKYRVIALANGWDLHWMDPSVLQPYLSGGESIEVAARGKYNLKVNVQ